MEERYYVIVQDFVKGGGCYISRPTYEEAEEVCNKIFPNKTTLIIKGTVEKYLL